MITVTNIREAAARVYGNQKVAIDYTYATVNHRDGKTSKTGNKLYRINSNGQQGEWMTGKDLYTKLIEIAEKIGR